MVEAGATQQSSTRSGTFSAESALYVTSSAGGSCRPRSTFDCSASGRPSTAGASRYSESSGRQRTAEASLNSDLRSRTRRQAYLNLRAFDHGQGPADVVAVLLAPVPAQPDGGQEVTGPFKVQPVLGTVAGALWKEELPLLAFKHLCS